MVQEIARGVFHLPVVMTNVYFVGERGGPWTLVDAGLPGSAAYIAKAAAEVYGPNNPPQAIVLTHGHFDHVGGLAPLAREWNVPVYAHRLELPYLTGRSSYPPPDPTVGGTQAFMMRFLPPQFLKFDFPREGVRVEALPDTNTTPLLPGWEILHTPGHSAGHVSFFRETDRALIAGDAFVTVNQDRPDTLLTQKPEIYRPPNYLTVDWPAAHASVIRLAAREPRLVATGHGRPMEGPEVAPALHHLADHFPIPDYGRYVLAPVQADADGVRMLPRPVWDRQMFGILGVSVAAIALYSMSRRKEN